MKLIHTHLTFPKTSKITTKGGHLQMDLTVCITAEILDVLLPQLDDHTATTYAFSRALQGSGA